MTLGREEHLADDGFEGGGERARPAAERLVVHARNLRCALVTDDLALLDATAQAELVARGELTARSSSTPRSNASSASTPGSTPSSIAASNGPAPKRPARRGPFAGVPFLVKDAVCHTAGDPYHAGMQVLKDAGWTEPDDTWLAARFRAAGFVFVGKTNTPELATSITTEPLAYGPTHNPWDDTRSTGGSSGGSAAAVAAGLVPVAHGNDMGGSIRFPASMCGIVGLKPTRARTTLGPDFGEYWGPLTHEFVLTRSMRDTAAVLDAVAGAAPGDPYTAPPPLRPYRDEVGAPVGRLRIGFRTETPDGEASGADAVDRGRVDRAPPRPNSATTSARPTFPRSTTATTTASSPCCRPRSRATSPAGARASVATSPNELEPMNTFFATMGAQISGVDYVAAIEALQAWTRRVARLVGRSRRAGRADESRTAGAARRARADEPRSRGRRRAWAGSSRSARRST